MDPNLPQGFIDNPKRPEFKMVYTYLHSLDGAEFETRSHFQGALQAYRLIREHTPWLSGRPYTSNGKIHLSKKDNTVKFGSLQYGTLERKVATKQKIKPLEKEH